MTRKAGLPGKAAASGAAAGAGIAQAAPLRAHSPAVSAARARKWGAFYYAEQVLRVMKNYGWTIVMYGVGQPVAYLFAMGVGLATLVDTNSTAAFGGVSYLVFIAPALLISAAVMTAGNEFTFPVMDGFKWARRYYARGATAASAQQVAIGELVAVGVRLALEAVLFWVILVLFGATDPTWSWLIIPVATLAGLAFGAPVMAYAATIEDEGFQFAMIQRFIVMPMFLFAGTFYPLASMPAYLQWIGWISPMWHGTQLARVLSFGLALPLWLVLVHVGFLLVLLLVGVVLAIRNFVARLAR